ncbi:MAG: EamA family transporter [Acidobacteriaceae bacterium]|nr:EamA family transporter [Acidobacteriaceae bacterium]
MRLTHIHKQHNSRVAYLALAAVCLFWGTTYLGIRIGLESLPPLYLIAIRYVISGSILLIAAALSGIPLPQGRELLLTAICGVICIGGSRLFITEAGRNASKLVCDQRGAAVCRRDRYVYSRQHL